jgi:hypothetical protein
MRSLILVTLLLSVAVLLQASSHGEAPGTAAAPQTDVTDVYAFRSYETGRDAYVTFIANFNPRESSYGGPNFYPLSDRHYYEIHVDQTGDGRPEITYQFVFHNELPNNGTGIALSIKGFNMPVALKAVGPISVGNNAALNFLEYYRLNVVTAAGSSAATISGTTTNFFQKPFDYAGVKTFPDYHNYSRQYIYNVDLPGCATAGKVFVGQRRESFSINIGKIFDLVNFVPIDGTVFPGGITQNSTNNVVYYTNIISIALEVPITCVQINASQPVIGVYATTRSIRGNRQKSRLGNPLVNELLIGLKDKDRWSRRNPGSDKNLLKYIMYPTFPAILDILFRSAVNSVLGTSFSSIAPTNFPRNDIVAAFLTGVPGLNLLQSGSKLVDLLRLNTATPVVARGNQSTFGVIAGDAAGYPNGRRPGDDVIDIVLRVAMGVLCHLNLGVCSPSQAVVGDQPITDGAPIQDIDFHTQFPYLNDPNPGSGPYYYYN